MKWGEVLKLGDELRAIEADDQDGYSAAARTYRALSVALRGQGITDAARFHYRSEVMERKALSREARNLLFSVMEGRALFREARVPLPSRKAYLALWLSSRRIYRIRVPWLSSWRVYRAPWLFTRWLVSWVLGTFMGYGDYISRLFLTYIGVVFAFAAIYLGVAYQPPKAHPLTAIPWPHALAAVSWVRDLVSFWLVRFPAALGVASTKYKLDALVFSVTAFHGRGLQVQPWSQQDAVIWWAGLEAVLGLLIEALFVAAFARRVTGG